MTSFTGKILRVDLGTREAETLRVPPEGKEEIAISGKYDTIDSSSDTILCRLG